MLNFRNLVCSVFAIFVTFSSANAATEMECAGVGYKYIDNIFAEDEAKILYPLDVDWSDFCPTSEVSDVVISKDYPSVTCEYNSEYDFKTSPIKFKDGGIGLQLYWRKMGGDWSEYLFTLGNVVGEVGYVDAGKSVPFDVVKIFHHFKDLHVGEVNWSWVTIYKQTDILNFETNREQFGYEVISTSGTNEFKSDFEKNTYNCE
jgi:hypothetical protein